jgi:VanZ family protein
MTAGKRKLAGVVALAYTLVIVYASLQPFAGWRMPPPEVIGFLTAPWPRYLPLADMLLNIVAYLPLGALLFAALRSRRPDLAAFGIATLMAATLSLALESVQMFLPTRVASNVDLLLNGAGAALGALAAWALVSPALAGSQLVSARRRMLRGDLLGDAALLIVALWIVIQFNQSPLAFSSGDMRDTLKFAPLLTHTPRLYLLAEACTAALAMIVIGLLVTLPLRAERSALPAITAALMAAFVVKSVATAILTRSTHWLQWLTPGVTLGIATGLLLLAWVLRAAPAARVQIAIACVIAGAAVVNMTPENPYQAPPLALLSPQTTHLINFSNILRIVAELWPLAAVAFLLVLMRVDRPSPPR